MEKSQRQFLSGWKSDVATVFLAMSLFLPYGLASADDISPLRQGLWEYNRTIQRPDRPEPQKVSDRECTDPNEGMTKQIAMLEKKGCKISHEKKTSDSYSFSWECSLKDGNKGVGHTEVTFNSDSAYTANIESEAHIAGKLTKTSEKLSAKRIGDCAN